MSWSSIIVGIIVGVLSAVVYVLVFNLITNAESVVVQKSVVFLYLIEIIMLLVLILIVNKYIINKMRMTKNEKIVYYVAEGIMFILSGVVGFNV